MRTGGKHYRTRSAGPDAADAGSRERVTRGLLLCSGILFGFAAIFYNEWTLGLLSSGEFPMLIRGRIRGSQALFGLTGALLILASVFLGRVSVLRTVGSRPAAPQVLLAVLAMLVPLLLLELGLRPFVERKTTLFVPDPVLGWRPRPGASGEWGHVQIEINAKGLRGPEVSWEKPPGVFRVLYLGDSVTFGFGLEHVEDTYPYLVDAELERHLGIVVETVNSGVGGWSPWQQRAYLRREGLRYQPDLIVVGFVLNDITDNIQKHSLQLFGGVEEAWQLSRTARSWLDGWLSHSALVSHLRDGFVIFRFGRDEFVGAQRYEAEGIRRLAAHTGHESLRRAWEITFDNLAKIFKIADRREIPAALVVFPFAFQLAEPSKTGGPQAMLRQFAEEREIPLLDLLPTLAASAFPAAEDTDLSAGGGLFLDVSHLSREGSRVAAAAIAEFLMTRGLAVTPLR